MFYMFRRFLGVSLKNKIDLKSEKREANEKQTRGRQVRQVYFYCKKKVDLQIED